MSQSPRPNRPMRKLLVLLVLAAGGIYGSGYLLLNESGVTALLEQLETFSREGNVEGACTLFDDRVEVSLTDNTRDSPMQLNGGKVALCAYLSEVLPLQHKFVAATQIERDHFIITRDWQDPWTVQASYSERRVDAMHKLDVPLPPQTAMRSHDQLTVILTWQGRKIARLTSVSEALAVPAVDAPTGKTVSEII